MCLSLRLRKRHLALKSFKNEETVGGNISYYRGTGTSRDPTHYSSLNDDDIPPFVFSASPFYRYPHQMVILAEKVSCEKWLCAVSHGSYR